MATTFWSVVVAASVGQMPTASTNTAFCAKTPLPNSLQSVRSFKEPLAARVQPKRPPTITEPGRPLKSAAGLNRHAQAGPPGHASRPTKFASTSSGQRTQQMSSAYVISTQKGAKARSTR